MTVDFPPIDLGALLEFFALVIGMAMVYGALRQDLRNIKEVQSANSKALADFMALNLDGRVKAVEAHGEKVDQIGPLVERVSQFERRLETAVRELTAAAFGGGRTGRIPP